MREIPFTNPLCRGEKIGITTTNRLKATIKNLHVEIARLQERVEKAEALLLCLEQ